MKTTHTPGPWTYYVGGLDPESAQIRIFSRPMPPLEKGGLNRLITIAELNGNEADALRIVACVNALEGMSIDEVAKLPALIMEGTGAIHECDQLRKERDELRLELGRILKHYGELVQHTEDKLMEHPSYASAKIKGGDK